MTDADVRELHDHLDATAELPVRPAASVRLGEAAAIAADVAEADLPREIVVERVRKVASLLDGIETTGNERADDHVVASRRAATRILDGAADG